MKTSPCTLCHVQTDAEGNQTAQFYLQTTAYYELRAYLAVGITLPSSVERFESDFPKAELQDLTTLDPDVYDVCSAAWLRGDLL